MRLNLKNPNLLHQQAYVNGQWADADSGETIAHVPRMSAAETRRAIEAANRAWPAWRKKTAKERAAILRR